VGVEYGGPECERVKLDLHGSAANLGHDLDARRAMQLQARDTAGNLDRDHAVGRWENAIHSRGAAIQLDL
jgi:hypothetical protein